MRRRCSTFLLRSTALSICVWFCCWSPVDAAAATTREVVEDGAEGPQTTDRLPPPHEWKGLDTLVSDFHAGLRHASIEREGLAKRMDGSRELIRDMFAHEREETQLYVAETRLKMQALRDVMRVEMAKTVRDVQQQVVYAAQNVSKLVQRREEVKRETEQRLRDLKQRRERAQQERRALLEEELRAEADIEGETRERGNGSRSEREEVKATAARAWTHHVCQIAQQYFSRAGSSAASTVSGCLEKLWAIAVGCAEKLWSAFSSTIVLIVATMLQISRRLLAPVAISLCVLLLMVVVVVQYKAHQRAKRRKGILYSGYLKSPRSHRNNPDDGRSSRSTQTQVMRHRSRRLPSRGNSSSTTSSSSSSAAISEVFFDVGVTSRPGRKKYVQ